MAPVASAFRPGLVAAGRFSLAVFQLWVSPSWLLVALQMVALQVHVLLDRDRMVQAALDGRLGLCHIPSLPLASHQKPPTLVLPRLHYSCQPLSLSSAPLELGGTRQVPEFAQPLQIWHSIKIAAIPFSNSTFLSFSCSFFLSERLDFHLLL